MYLLSLWSAGRLRVQGRALIKLRKDRCMDGKEHQHIETNEHLVREQKVQALRAQNIEPWPENISLDARCADVIATYKADHEQEYTVAGRVMAIRGHGKSTFATIQDRSGTLQVYFKQDALGETQYRFFSQYIDTGDSIMVSGGSFKTKMGEISIAVKSFKLLSKSVRPLPAKFHGIVDQETKYRQRYLDLLSVRILYAGCVLFLMNTILWKLKRLCYTRFRVVRQLVRLLPITMRWIPIFI